jgi:hypothetical protein
VGIVQLVAGFLSTALDIWDPFDNHKIMDNKSNEQKMARIEALHRQTFQVSNLDVEISRADTLSIVNTLIPTHLAMIMYIKNMTYVAAYLNALEINAAGQELRKDTDLYRVDNVEQFLNSQIDRHLRFNSPQEYREYENDVISRFNWYTGKVSNFGPLICIAGFSFALVLRMWVLAIVFTLCLVIIIGINWLNINEININTYIQLYIKNAATGWQHIILRNLGIWT